MAFAAKRLKAKTSYVVRRPSLYAAWDWGIICSRTLSFILLITQIAKIFLRIDSRIIGLRFSGGPFFFPGFCNGVRCPIFISLGYSPVSAELFSRSAICSYMTSGAYFKCSVLRESHPALVYLWINQSFTCKYRTEDEEILNKNEN